MAFRLAGIALVWLALGCRPAPVKFFSESHEDVGHIHGLGQSRLPVRWFSNHGRFVIKDSSTKSLQVFSFQNAEIQHERTLGLQTRESKPVVAMDFTLQSFLVATRKRLAVFDFDGALTDEVEFVNEGHTFGYLDGHQIALKIDVTGRWLWLAQLDQFGRVNVLSDWDLLETMGEDFTRFRNPILFEDGSLIALLADDGIVRVDVVQSAMSNELIYSVHRPMSGVNWLGMISGKDDGDSRTALIYSREHAYVLDLHNMSLSEKRALYAPVHSQGFHMQDHLMVWMENGCLENCPVQVLWQAADGKTVDQGLVSLSRERYRESWLLPGRSELVVIASLQGEQMVSEQGFFRAEVTTYDLKLGTQIKAFEYKSLARYLPLGDYFIELKDSLLGSLALRSLDDGRQVGETSGYNLEWLQTIYEEQ